MVISISFDIGASGCIRQRHPAGMNEEPLLQSSIIMNEEPLHSHQWAAEALSSAGSRGTHISGQPRHSHQRGGGLSRDDFGVHVRFFGDFRIFISVLAVLGPEIGPDRPDLPRYFVLDQNLPLASHATPFRGRNVQKPVDPGLCASGVLDVSVQFRLRPRQLFCALKFCLSKCLLLGSRCNDVTAGC